MNDCFDINNNNNKRKAVDDIDNTQLKKFKPNTPVNNSLKDLEEQFRKELLWPVNNKPVIVDANKYIIPVINTKEVVENNTIVEPDAPVKPTENDVETEIIVKPTENDVETESIINPNENNVETEIIIKTNENDIETESIINPNEKDVEIESIINHGIEFINKDNDDNDISSINESDEESVTGSDEDEISCSHSEVLYPLSPEAQRLNFGGNDDDSVDLLELENNKIKKEHVIINTNVCY